MASKELFRAARDGNIERVRAALAAGADPNAFLSWSTGSSGNNSLVCSSLHIAVYVGPHEVVRILVAGGGDVNLRMPDQYANQTDGGMDLQNLTPLMLALQGNVRFEGNRLAIVATLIAAGAEVDASVSPYDWTAFTFALVYGFRASLLELLRAGATIVPSGAERTVRNEDCFALLDTIEEAGGFVIFATTQQRAVPVAILGKIFGAALPHDVLPIVASFWMPRGGF